MKKMISIVSVILLLICVSVPMFAAETQLATPKITKCESLDEGTKVTWNPVYGAELYRVYYKGSSGWINMGATDETSFIDTSVSSGTTQVYTVRCINKEQNAFTSDFDRTGFKYTYNLKTPEIAAITGTSGGVNIKWNAVPNAVKYRVYYKGSNGWTKMAETEETSYLDTNAVWGSTYTYTVRCVNAAGNRFTSSFNSTGWKYTYYLKTPQITELKNVTNGVQITWGAVEGAEKYRVYYKSSSGWTKMTETDKTSYLDTKAVLGNTYTYTVRCVNAAGNRFTSSFNSAGWACTRYLDTPQITELKSATNGVQITWGAVEGAEKYRVYYKSSSGWTKMTETDKTSYLDTKAVLGDTYTYTVRCVNAAGNAFTSSFNSTGWTHTRYLDTPQITSLKSVGKGIQITWGKVQGAEKYRVYYYGKSGWTKMGETTGTSFIHDNVDIGTAYRYTVRCVNSSSTKFTSAHNSTGWTHTYNPQLDTPQITSINVGAKGTEISWNAVPGADLYRVYCKIPYGSWTKIADVRTTTCIHVPDRTNCEYTYTVRCLSSGAKGFASDFNHEGTKFRAMSSEPWISGTVARMDSIELYVTAADRDARVRIYRKENGSWTRIGEIKTKDTNYFYDYDVVPGKTYTYTARCVGEDGSFISYFNTKGFTQKYVASECYPELEFFIYDGTNIALVQPKGDDKFGIKHFYLHTYIDYDYKGTFEIDDEPVYIRADFFSVNRNYLFEVVGVDAKGNEITKTNRIRVETLGSPTDFKADKIGDRRYRLSWKKGAGQPNGYYVSLLSADGTIEVGSDLIKGLSYDIDLSEYPEDTEWVFIVWATSKDEISNSWITELEFKEADYQ